MIISEKQIMMLMNAAEHYVTLNRLEHGGLTDYAKAIKKLITAIQLQQPDELKEIL